MKLPDTLALKQIERRLAAIRAATKHQDVKSGWINYLRQALGMSRKTLASRAGISKAAIQHAESRELEGRVTIATLRKIADAMGCQLTYAFVPDKPIKEVLDEQAKTKARELLKQADVHMELEDQKVKSDLEDRVEALAADLLTKGDIW